MKTCCLNILEGAAVTLSVGAEDASYPLYRLYDRMIGKVFKGSAAATTTVKIDQGAAPAAVDRLIIPAGHNLGGVTLTIKHSADDVTYTDAVAGWVQPDGLMINKSWAAVTKRYWKFTITTPAAAPYLTEMFLTATYEWERDPARSESGPFDDVFNVDNLVRADGGDRFAVRGEPKRQRPYGIVNAPETMKTALLALNSAWAGCRPFWLYDHEGTWIFGKLAEPLELKQASYQRYNMSFKFLEVLP